MYKKGEKIIIGRKTMVCEYTESDISQTVKRLAKEFHKKFPTIKELIAVKVLEGATYFATDFLRAFASLSPKTQVIEGSVKISRWLQDFHPGKPTMLKELDLKNEKTEGKIILILEDIIEEGINLEFLVRHHLKEKKPAKIIVCALLSKIDKNEQRIKLLEQKENVEFFIGYKIDTQKEGNKWYIGYGMDHNGAWRNIPVILTYQNISDV